MRKKFILFILIPLIIVAAVVYFFVDRWIEAGLEYAGESAVGAVVEIDNLKLTLSPIGIRFSRLQVADPNDPWKNVFETGKVQFALNFGQLLRGKYIIETAEVNDVILGTRRTTDGSLPESRRPQKKASSTESGIKFADLAESALKNHVVEHPLLDPSLLKSGFNVDSLLKVVNLRSLSYIDSLKTQATAVTAQWPAAINDMDNAKRRLAAIDSSVRTINPSGLKDVASITSAISTVDQATKGIKEIVGTVDARQASIKGDIGRMATSVGNIDDVVKEDYRKLLTLAKLPDLNAMGLAEALLGRQLIAKVKQYLNYVDMARAKMAEYKSEPEVEKPPRMKGQDIHFPVDRAYPKFWLKNLVISGGTDRKQDSSYLYAKGEVNNITNDQRATHVPLTAKLSGTEGGTISAGLAASIDRRQEVPVDEYSANIAGLRLQEIAIGSESFLKGNISGAQLAAEVNVKIPGDRFDGTANLHFRNVGFAFAAEPSNVGERLAREVLSGVNGFEVNLRGWKTDTGFDVALATDLDEQFSNRVKAVLGAELTKVQENLKARVNAVVAKKRQEFDALYTARKAQVEQQLAQYQALVNEKVSLVESKKKELEEKLEKAKKGAIDDAVKKLFKK